MSEESDEAEPELSEKFLDKLPDELIEECIWPRLLVLPPINSAGMCEGTLTQEERKEMCEKELTQEERKEHIRQMCLLRQVCRGWRQWVGEHEDWNFKVGDYHEEFILHEKFLAWMHSMALAAESSVGCTTRDIPQDFPGSSCWH